MILTPAHVTDLFCDLASVDKDSIIYDPCCGTGGFLISAMKRMLTDAGGDEEKKSSIRKNQLIGVELRPSMFTYACSNMMMRGDGKSNIRCGDCFPLEDIIKVYETNKNRCPGKPLKEFHNNNMRLLISTIIDSRSKSQEIDK